MPDDRPRRAALGLARRGARVFPCAPRSKAPAVATGLKAATDDLAAIEQWWRQQPEFNVGVATGAVSGFFAVDVDGPDAEGELRKLEAEHGALPATVEVITARGRHLYFRMPDAPVPNSAGKIALNVDVRGDGGYVLAPPSIHPSGRPYCWSVDSANKMAPAPDWLLDKIAAPASDSNNQVTPPSEWRDLVKGLSEGVRNDSITRFTGHLLRHYVDPFVTLELIRTFNATRCSPPLSDEEIKRIVSSVAGRELRRRQASRG